MNHSKEIGANLGESGRDVVGIVSSLSLISSADCYGDSNLSPNETEQE